MSSKMKAAQISKAGGDWELVERDRGFLTVRSRKSIKGNRDNTNGAPERVQSG